MFKYIIIILFLSCSSCKKNTTNTDCFPDATTIEQIIDKPAIIKATGNPGEYFIILQGSIDRRLRPCNLSEEFKINNLSVMVSGLVKGTVQGGPLPCCTYDFTITKISK